MPVPYQVPADSKIGGYKFIVSAGSVPIGGFRNVSGLESPIEIAEYREGTSTFAVQKFPGIMNFPNVVLERGVSLGGSGRELIDWHNRLTGLLLGTGQAGGVAADYVADLTIRVLSRFTKVSATRLFTVHEAWPATLSYADLDAMSSDIWIERCELAHNGLTVEVVGGPFVGAAS